MNNQKFVTAINCMDGRVQLPVIEWMKKMYQADYIDMITEPGPNKILAENKPDPVINSLKKKVEISVNKHKSTCVAIIGHFDCAGNPVEKETQVHQIHEAIQTVHSWGLKVTVIGLWIDEQWTVHKIE